MVVPISIALAHQAMAMLALTAATLHAAIVTQRHHHSSKRGAVTLDYQ